VTDPPDRRRPVLDPAGAPRADDGIPHSEPEDSADGTREAPSSATSSSSTTQKVLAWGALAFLAVGAGLCGSMVLTLGSRVFGGGQSAEPEPPPVTRTVAPTQDMVVAIQDLARLESVQFHMERVVDLRERQRRLFGLVEAEDAILLVAAGDVRAGVDLGELAADAVTITPDGSRAQVVLPLPQILSARLDEGRTYVHTRQTETLARRSETLETRARQEAERTIEASAVEAGILDRARENARRTVTALVRSLGVPDVDVVYADEVPTGIDLGVDSVPSPSGPGPQGAAPGEATPTQPGR